MSNDFTIKAIITGVVLLIVGALFAACEEAREWNEYRKTNGCEQTGRQRFRNSSQYNGNQFITTTVAVDEWKCVNGEIRWRDAR